jgi:maltooligosyltrehalose trehalohydrolase
MKGERLSALLSLEALKLAAGIVLLSPNIPLLFMGEEYGEKAPFHYFISHSDPGLIEAVRNGRKAEFSAFQWEAELPDPQDEGTFFRSKIHLALRQHGDHKILLEYYKALINLRKEIPALSHLDKVGMEIKKLAEKPTLFMLRRYEKDRVCGLFNFWEKPQEINISIEQGVWEKVFDSSDVEWGGPGSSASESIQSNGREFYFPMGAYSFVLYRGKKAEE